MNNFLSILLLPVRNTSLIKKGLRHRSVRLGKNPLVVRNTSLIKKGLRLFLDETNEADV